MTRKIFRIEERQFDLPLPQRGESAARENTNGFDANLLGKWPMPHSRRWLWPDGSWSCPAIPQTVSALTHKTGLATPNRSNDSKILGCNSEDQEVPLPADEAKPDNSTSAPGVGIKGRLDPESLCPVLCPPPNPIKCYPVSGRHSKVLLDKASVTVDRNLSHSVQVVDSLSDKSF
jgi:hypothetical protein